MNKIIMSGIELIGPDGILMRGDQVLYTIPRVLKRIGSTVYTADIQDINFNPVLKYNHFSIRDEGNPDEYKLSDEQMKWIKEVFPIFESIIKSEAFLQKETDNFYQFVLI